MFVAEYPRFQIGPRQSHKSPKMILGGSFHLIPGYKWDMQGHPRTSGVIIYFLSLDLLQEQEKKLLPFWIPQVVDFPWLKKK